MGRTERRVYRVRPEPGLRAAVRLHAAAPERDLGEASVVDMSLRGLGVVLDAPDAGTVGLERGALLRVEILLPGHAASIKPAVRSRFVVVLPDGRVRVGLEIEEPEEMLAAIPVEWVHRFNRRESQRTHGLALDAWLELDGDSTPGRIISLSPAGAGVIVMSGAELDLYPRRNVALSFDVSARDEASAAIELRATVTDSGQRVTESGFLPYVGLAFHPQKTPAFKDKSLAIWRVLRARV